MDLTPGFRNKLEKVYAEKYQLFYAWTSTGATRPGLFLSCRIVPENFPFKNMLIWRYGIDANKRSHFQEEKRTVTPEINTQLELSGEKEGFDGADRIMHVKDKPQKMTRFQRFIRLFTACFRGL